MMPGEYRRLCVLIAFVCCLVFGLVLLACGKEAPKPEPFATKTSPQETEVALARTVIAVGPSELDGSALRIKGRDHFQACVEVLDDSASPEDASQTILTALLKASYDERWHRHFGTPTADVGCPLPPAALQGQKDRFEEAICSPVVGPYLVYVFVGDAALFSERFPDDIVRPRGTRVADQEALRQGSAKCANSVAEAWYLTPEDLLDEALLEEYILPDPPCC
jgi:hypothetical protein